MITFDGPAGAPPDPAVWSFETGGGGWGNGELQTYTADNAYLDGFGRLQIVARRGWTSARINTLGKCAIPPGSSVEATITAPTGAGAWPAFWLLGTNIAERGWPDCGELDVFEGWGSRPGIAHAAMHLAGVDDPHTDRPYDWDAPGGTTHLPQPVDAPHAYGVYFDETVVRFSIDGEPTLTVTAAEARASGRRWPYGEPFYVVLNVAVSREADPDDPAWPKEMTVGPITVRPGRP